MSWPAGSLDRIGAADELDLSSHRADGSRRPFVTMWAVVVGGELYVRSAYGPENGWYRRALTSGSGTVRAGGVEAEVTFTHAVDVDHAAVDAEYHRKYDRYGAGNVKTVVGPAAHAVTVRLDPVDDGG